MVIGFYENFIFFLGNCSFHKIVKEATSTPYAFRSTCLRKTSLHLVSYYSHVHPMWNFPGKSVKVPMYQPFLGAVLDEIVLDSFLHLLPPAETKVLSNILNHKKALPLVLDEVLDIFHEYQERTPLTSSNLKATLVKIGKAEFVTKLFLPLLKIREGMGKFWDSVTKEEVDSVYELCTSSPTRVIKLLCIVPVNLQEAKVERWLQWYLREADSVTFGLFLRFSTGNMVLPGRQVKVRFENMAFLAMRPTARTCFRVLTLPQNYQTYHPLRENLNFLLRIQCFGILKTERDAKLEKVQVTVYRIDSDGGLWMKLQINVTVGD